MKGRVIRRSFRHCKLIDKNNGTRRKGPDRVGKEERKVRKKQYINEGKIRTLLREDFS